ncbi:MAG TPA: sugar transferase [Anaerolineae bacterium]|nr:sugar transferase [Anaerolineae bacterium]
MRVYQQLIKRLMDVTLSLLGLTLSLPLSLVIALLIKIDSQGPVLFRQTRIGKDGKPFTCYKFRTMYVDAPDIRNPDGSTFNAEDDPRVTRVGRFLRKTTLDELAQFINVLKGDMSIVGPRPDLPDQVRLYSERHKKRLLVKPGMTGWAWIHGRNSIPWELRRELDVEYVENYSLWLDFQILLRTIPMVLLAKGVYVAPEVKPLRHEGTKEN